MIRREVLAALLACWLLAATASADTLSTLLQGVSEAARPAAPLRAEGTIESDGLKGKDEDRVVLIERAGSGPKSPAQLHVELAKAKTHVLALGPSDVHVAVDGKESKPAADGTVASLSFAAEDFLPFSPERCAAMRIADLSEEQFTIVCEPKKPPSQYSLMVYKFDREKSVLLQVLLYKDSMTNLVKMLRNDDFVQVGSKWRPKRVVMQDFKLRTKDVLALEWKPAAGVPAEAFDPKAFAASSLAAPGRKP